MSILTSQEYKDIATSGGRIVHMALVYGDLVIDDSINGTLISIDYDLPNEMVIGSVPSASVEIAMSARDWRGNTIIEWDDLIKPFYIFQSFEGADDVIKIGPFTMDPESYSEEQNMLIKFTAYDNMGKLDQYFSSSHLPNGTLTGSVYLNSFLTQAGLTLHPESDTLHYDSIKLPGLNAGYSTDVPLRALVSDYLEINLAAGFIKDGQLCVKSLMDVTELLDVDGSLYESIINAVAVGPINTLAITNSGDNDSEPYKRIYENDPTAVDKDGVQEYRIDNNRFTDINPEFFLKPILVRILGYSYSAITIEGFQARLDLEPFDTLGLIDLMDRKHTFTMADVKWSYDGGLSGEIVNPVFTGMAEEYVLDDPEKQVFRKVALKVDDHEGKITGLIEFKDETVDKITQLELTTDGLVVQVAGLSNEDAIIPNSAFTQGWQGWTVGAGLYPKEDIFPEDTLYPIEVKTDVLLPRQEGLFPSSTSLFPTDKESNPIALTSDDHRFASGASASFIKSGTITSDLGWVKSGSKVSIHMIRVGNGSIMDIEVLEYENSTTQMFKPTHTSKIVNDNRTGGIVVGSIVLQPNTKYIRIRISIDFKGPITLADINVTHNQPTAYKQSAQEAKLYAKSLFDMTDDKIVLLNEKVVKNEETLIQTRAELEIMDDTIKLDTQRIEGLYGDIHSTILDISATKGVVITTTEGDGLTVINNNNETSITLNTRGGIEGKYCKFEDAEITGTITAGYVGGWMITETRIESYNGNVALDSREETITLGPMKFEPFYQNGHQIVRLVGNTSGNNLQMGILNRSGTYGAELSLSGRNGARNIVMATNNGPLNTAGLVMLGIGTGNADLKGLLVDPNTYGNNSLGLVADFVHAPVFRIGTEFYTLSVDGSGYVKAQKAYL